jgi:hypothetical protein
MKRLRRRQGIVLACLVACAASILAAAGCLQTGGPFRYSGSGSSGTCTNAGGQPSSVYDMVAHEGSTVLFVNATVFVGAGVVNYTLLAPSHGVAHGETLTAAKTDNEAFQNPMAGTWTASFSCVPLSSASWAVTYADLGRS